jgi:Flp pilus assembly protein protease CpaA
MDWQTLILENWHVKFVCVVLIVAAYIDGRQLRVPNWLTFPMVLGGIVFNVAMDGTAWPTPCWAPSSGWPVCCRFTASEAWGPAT